MNAATSNAGGATTPKTSRHETALVSHTAICGPSSDGRIQAAEIAVNTFGRSAGG